MDWAANHYNWDATATFTTPSHMARGVFNCNTGLAPYQGSTAKDLNCAWSPITPNPVDTKYYSYDPYSFPDPASTHRPDADWYILGDEPMTS
jgi:hypothetical protein